MLEVSIFSLFLLFFCWILEMFRQCGIFRNVQTVWYFQKCSDSVVFFVFVDIGGIDDHHCLSFLFRGDCLFC